MVYVFSDREGIRIAIEMEARGEAFYRRAARVSRSEQTVDLLNALAKDEMNHRAEFERLYQSESAHLSDAEYDEETNAYLSAVAADVVFPGGLMALREEGFESPEAVLKYAIDSEKDLFCSTPKSGTIRRTRTRRVSLRKSCGRSAVISTACSAGSHN